MRYYLEIDTIGGAWICRKATGERLLYFADSEAARAYLERFFKRGD